MKKIIPLSLVAMASLYAAEINLAPIGVESTVITEVAENAQVSADVAEALSSRVPSIDMSRRSGIANDILIRGQKRDNISIEVDGTKVHGACPNRMDPPTSHILANQIETVEVTEGPYDVETFGVMSGGVKIKTKQPTKKYKGEVDLGLGSFGYQKLSLSASGGNDTVRLSIAASTEKSGQYEDGNGNDFAQQIKENPTATAATRYQTQYQGMDAYEKKSIMAKVFVTVTDNQEIRLGVTANRSDNILYPNSKMDALYDDSNIYSVEYNIDSLSKTYKNLNLQYYYSDVDHPMGTHYRNASTGNHPVSGNPNTPTTNALTTKTQGLKLKNTFTLNSDTLIVGVDGSKREWDGHYEKNNIPNGGKSINNAQTDNIALFAKYEKSHGNLNFKVGTRYDSTDITNAAGLQNNSYTGLNANIMTTLQVNNDVKVFLGFGQAQRVPDARELYFTSFTGNVVGTSNLEQTTNREIDAGYEISTAMFSIKGKAFYSKLSDYIYIEKTTNPSAFQNIDATVYGAEFSAEYYATDDMIVDTSVSYKRGTKDEALQGTNQTDKDLADMAPLRATFGVTYEYAMNSTLRAELQISDTWDKIDSDNGEQKIAAWQVVNLKAKHAFSKNIGLTVGVNNLFDETYATSNTYADLTLLSSGSADVMLFNNPGRYLYTNLQYKF